MRTSLEAALPLMHFLSVTFFFFFFFFPSFLDERWCVSSKGGNDFPHEHGVAFSEASWDLLSHISGDLLIYPLQILLHEAILND